MWTWIKTHKALTALVVLAIAIAVTAWRKWPDTTKIEASAKAEMHVKLQQLEDEKKVLADKLASSEKFTKELDEWSTQQTNKLAAVSNELVQVKAALEAATKPATTDAVERASNPSSSVSSTLTIKVQEKSQAVDREHAEAKLQGMFTSGTLVDPKAPVETQRAFGEALASMSVPSKSGADLKVTERFVPAGYLLVPTWEQQQTKLGGNPEIDIPLYKGELVAGTKTAPPVDIDLESGYYWFHVTDAKLVNRAWKHAVEQEVLWGRKKGTAPKTPSPRSSFFGRGSRTS